MRRSPAVVPRQSIALHVWAEEAASGPDLKSHGENARVFGGAYEFDSLPRQRILDPSGTARALAFMKLGPERN